MITTTLRVLYLLILITFHHYFVLQLASYLPLTVHLDLAIAILIPAATITGLPLFIPAIKRLLHLTGENTPDR